MKEPFSILLIDDNEADNFMHSLVLKEAELAREIVAIESGAEALRFLTTRRDGDYVRPDLIFLDINMPRMNGWEFLEEYVALPEECRAGAVIIMLTTSLNPRDREQALATGRVVAFLPKPLDTDALRNVIKDLED